MKRREFILGMAIITLCVTIWTILEPPVINSTINVDISRIYKITSRIDEEGNVEIEVE